MRRDVLTLFVCLFLACSANDAAAQFVERLTERLTEPWTDRGYFNLNVGFETASGTLSDNLTFRLPNDIESGTMNFDSDVDSGAMFDFSVGSRVWRNVSVGLGYHRGSTDGDGTFQASVPNPAFFNSHRNVIIPISGLDRTESAVHLLLGYMVPIDDRLSVHVTIGPSFFRLRQEVVNGATFTESSFPFTTVTATPAVVQRSDSATGFNIGADVAYKLWENPNIKVGGGLFIRYAGASANIEILDDTVESNVGGFQIGFGGRLRF